MPLYLDKHDPQRDLLRHVLRGEKLTPDDLDHVLTVAKEDVHLDYKSGQILDKDKGRDEPGHPKTFHGKVKKHVAGLANADGGVLVVGVGDPQHAGSGGARKVDGCKGDADDLVAKVREAVKELRPYLTGHTPVHVVDHPDGLVLVVGVDKSDSRVLVVEGGRALHYLRLHDSTTHAPEYLVEDLVLGRWRKPTFSTEITHLEVVEGESDRKILRFSIRITNTGLVWMDKLRVGMVGYTEEAQFQAASDALAPMLDVRGWGEPMGDEPFGVPQVIPFDVEPALRAANNGPFEAVLAEIRNENVRIPCGGRMFWAGALFVSCYNQPPTWFQVVVFVHRWRRVSWLVPLRDRRAVIAVHLGSDSTPWKPAIEWFKAGEKDGGRFPFRFVDDEFEYDPSTDVRR